MAAANCCASWPRNVGSLALLDCTLGTVFRCLAAQFESAPRTRSMIDLACLLFTGKQVGLHANSACESKLGSSRRRRLPLNSRVASREPVSRCGTANKRIARLAHNAALQVSGAQTSKQATNQPTNNAGQFPKVSFCKDAPQCKSD